MVLKDINSQITRLRKQTLPIWSDRQFVKYGQLENHTKY